MGDTKRQFNNLYSKFSQRFKKPFDNIGLLMEEGFTDSDFVDKFRELYNYLWLQIEKEYHYWKKKNEKLLKLGKQSRYNFPKPENFVLYKSIHVRNKYRKSHLSGERLNQQEKEDLLKELRLKNEKKILIQSEQEFEKLKLIQEITPDFIKEFINEYFTIKNVSDESINRKHEIILEVSKYKSTETVAFFQKVNAIEKNYNLKKEAFQILQRMNEKVILRRKSKGKKKEMNELITKIEENPDKLLHRIYNDSLEVIKDFDFFISHSSNDESEIITIFKLLNKQGFHVYIDWVNDKYALTRDLVNENTAHVLTERLLKAKYLFYYHSSDSAKSQWTPWELGYFHALGKSIFVFNPKDLPIPEFVKLYNTVKVVDSQFCVCNNSKSIKLNDWILTNSK